MPKFFVTQNQIQNETIQITGKDVNHIKNVLRMKKHDKLTICIKETQKDATCEIQNLEEETITCKILQTKENQVETNIQISIYQSLPKSDKMELIIQKSVELGVYEIYPVKMKRNIVKIQEKDEQKKLERWQKISEVAAKQCGRGKIPEIKKITNIEEISNQISKYDTVLIAYEKETQNTIKAELKKLTPKAQKKEQIKIAIIIGPEGGIDETEIEQLKKQGAKTVTLGKRILRTETVALNVLSNIMYELEQ